MLREKIADEISDIQDCRARDEMLEAADRILALPEIADQQTEIARLEAKIDALEHALQYPR